MSARILVIGENDAVRARLAAQHFDVSSVSDAGDGVEALEAARRLAPDLILLAGGAFSGVCRTLKASEAFPDTLIAVLTPPSPDAVRLAFQVGADDVISSLPDADILAAKLRALARARALRESLTYPEGGAEGMNAPTAEDNAPGRIVFLSPGANDETRALVDALGASHSITPAHDVAEALRAQGEIILFDFRGGEADLLSCAQLRAARETRDVPLLALAEGPVALARALDLGLDDYMLAPFDAIEARARIETQLARKRLHERLRGQMAQNIRMAVRDPLSGLYNRRFLMTQLPHMLRAASRKNPLSLLLMDLDRFKSINDAYGHDAGDAILARVAKELQEMMRPGDFLCRMGGEEFVALLPGVDAGAARQIAGRLCAAISGLQKTSGAGVTISIGCATHTGVGDTPRSLLKRADQALYRAKEAGRNAVA